MPDFFTEDIRLGKFQTFFRTHEKRCFKTKTHGNNLPRASE